MRRTVSIMFFGLGLLAASYVFAGEPMGQHQGMMEQKEMMAGQEQSNPAAEDQEKTVSVEVGQENVSQNAPVDVGNKICPISGKVIPEGKAVKVEYKGKIYNFCCPACAEVFKSNPEEYIKKVQNQMKTKSE